MYKSVDWQSLKRLNKIRDLYVNVRSFSHFKSKPNLFIPLFLNNLSSRETMQEITINTHDFPEIGIGKDAIFRGIRNFPNLEIIRLDTYGEIENSYFEIIHTYIQKYLCFEINK